MGNILRKQNRMMNCPAVTAGQIPYRNVTVKDKLDELDNRASANMFDERVDISSATSSDKYTAPSDGYLFLGGSSTGSYVTFTVEGKIYLTAMQGNAQYNSLYVKKGMQMWDISHNGTYVAYFCPLEGSALPSAESEGF